LADAEDNIGLVTDGWVRLGEDEVPEISCDVAPGPDEELTDGADGGTEGVDKFGIAGGGCVVALLFCWVDCVTAPAAAAEYRIGGNVAGGRDCGGKPAFTMLDIGC
jgi:hypothetical protein